MNRNRWSISSFPNSYTTNYITALKIDANLCTADGSGLKHYWQYFIACRNRGVLQFHVELCLQSEPFAISQQICLDSLAVCPQQATENSHRPAKFSVYLSAYHVPNASWQIGVSTIQIFFADELIECRIFSATWSPMKILFLWSTRSQRSLTLMPKSSDASTR